jgi:hypothetical protein
MTNTTRLGMTLVEDTDTVGGSDPNTSMKQKVNNALQKLDKTAGRVQCTSTTRPTTDLFPGIEAYETDTRRSIQNLTGVAGDANWRVMQEDTVNSLGAGRIRAVRPVRPYGGDAAHSAFPGVVVLRNGSLVMVYRQGTDHATSRDGHIRKAFSTDQGRTWTGSSVVMTPPVGTDLRDPSVSLSRDGTKIYLTYFKATAISAATGVFFRTSTDGGNTWSAEVRVDNQSYAAVSAPAVELDTGTLVVPWYGKAGGEGFDSVWTAKSTDGGVNWTNTRILNGQTSSTNFQEPWISMKPGTQIGVMAYRYNTNASIGTSTTADNTVNWSGAVARFAGTGRPTIWWANDTTVAVIYRRLTRLDAVIRLSRNNGVAFEPERLMEKAWNVGSLGMTYAAVDKLSNGATVCVFAQEASTTLSRLFTTYIAEAGATTPFGVVPQENEAVSNNYDNISFVTQFDQVDGLPAYPWFNIVGANTVVEGELRCGSANNVPEISAVYVNHSDMVVEVEIACESTSTISGAGVVFRMIDANNYLYWVYEGGNNTRIYRSDAGVLTVVKVDTPYNVQLGTFNTYRVHVRGNGIWCFLNDRFITETALPAGDFQTGRWAGVRLNDQAAGLATHRVRRFMVRS